MEAQLFSGTIEKVKKMRAAAARQNGITIDGQSSSVLEESIAMGTKRDSVIAQSNNKSVQLKFWNDKVRGLPNTMARSALFTASNKPRRQFKNTQLISSSEFKLFYTGEELRQIDEDVFLQIVHLGRMRPLGDVLEISGYQLLKALGWSKDSRSYQRLRDSIERLTNANVKIHFETKDKNGYIGSMIRKVLWTGQSAGTTKWLIYLEPEIISLFDYEGYSLIIWEQRLGLRDLAKWLLSFYYTHAVPYSYKVETIYGMCGSQAKTLNHFRTELRGALEDLKTADFLLEWKIDVGDLVNVTRNNRPLLQDSRSAK